MMSQKITTEEKSLVQQNSASDKVLVQIQQAFDNATIPVNIKTSYQNTNVQTTKKDFILKTKYFLKTVQPKSNGILLSGIGSAALEKPIKLGLPTRLALDLPNTLTDTNIRTKSFQYGTDNVRIGQFEADKARIVVNTENTDKYLPIYSADGQSILVADKERLSHDNLSNIKTNLTSVKYTQTNEQNYGLNFYFSKIDKLY